MTAFVIVTPSYNSAEFIERTIDSVLSQIGDFTVRYHVQDGGSSDGTLLVLSRMLGEREPHPLSPERPEVTISWASERDAGMYQGINLAFDAALRSCEWDPHTTVLTWINSDDLLAPGGLVTIADVLSRFDDLDLITGRLGIIDERGAITHINEMSDIARPLMEAGLYDGRNFGLINQEGTFWRLGLWTAAGGLNPALKLAGDWDLWRRFGRFATLACVDSLVAFHRRREGQLSGDVSRYFRELDTILDDLQIQQRNSALLEFQTVSQFRDVYRQSRFASIRVHYDFGAQLWERSGQSVLPLLPRELIAENGRSAGEVFHIAGGAAHGIGPYPEWNIPAGVRWISERTVSATLDRPVAARGEITIILRVYSPELGVSVIFNEEIVFVTDLRPHGNDREVELRINVAATSGLNYLRLEFEGTSFGPYSVMLIATALTLMKELEREVAEVWNPVIAAKSAEPISQEIAWIQLDVQDVVGRLNFDKIPSEEIWPWLRICADRQASSLREALASLPEAARFIQFGRRRNDCIYALDEEAPTLSDRIAIYAHPVSEKSARVSCVRTRIPLAVLDTQSRGSIDPALFESFDLTWSKDYLLSVLTADQAAGSMPCIGSSTVAIDLGDRSVDLATPSANRICLIFDGPARVIANGSAVALLAESFSRVGTEASIVNVNSQRGTDAHGRADRWRQLLSDLDNEGYDGLFAFPDDIADLVAADLASLATRGFMCRVSTGSSLAHHLLIDPCNIQASAERAAYRAEIPQHDNVVLRMPSTEMIRTVLEITPDTIVFVMDRTLSSIKAQRALVTRIGKFEAGERPWLLVGSFTWQAKLPANIRFMQTSFSSRLHRVGWAMVADSLVTDAGDDEVTDDQALRAVANMIALPLISSRGGGNFDESLRTLEASRLMRQARYQAYVTNVQFDTGAAVLASLIPSRSDASFLTLPRQSEPIISEILPSEDDVREIEPVVWSFRPGPGLSRLDSENTAKYVFSPGGGCAFVRPGVGGSKRLRFAFESRGKLRTEILSFLVGDRMIDRRAVVAGDDEHSLFIDIDHEIQDEVSITILRESQTEKINPERDLLFLRFISAPTYSTVGRLSSISGTGMLMTSSQLPNDGSMHFVSGASFSRVSNAGEMIYSVHGKKAVFRIFSVAEGSRLLCITLNAPHSTEVGITLFSQTVYETVVENDINDLPIIEFSAYFHIGYNEFVITLAPDDDPSFDSSEFNMEISSVRIKEDDILLMRHSNFTLTKQAPLQNISIDWEKSFGFSREHPESKKNGLGSGFRWINDSVANICITGRSLNARLNIVYRNANADQTMTVWQNNNLVFKEPLLTTGLVSNATVSFPFVLIGGFARLKLDLSSYIVGQSGEKFAILVESLVITS